MTKNLFRPISSSINPVFEFTVKGPVTSLMRILPTISAVASTSPVKPVIVICQKLVKGHSDNIFVSKFDLRSEQSFISVALEYDFF